MRIVLANRPWRKRVIHCRDERELFARAYVIYRLRKVVAPYLAFQAAVDQTVEELFQ